MNYNDALIASTWIWLKEKTPLRSHISVNLTIPYNWSRKSLTLINQ